MQTRARVTSGCIALLVLISLCTIFFRLGGLPFIGADEPRYARIAQEMMEQGRWVTPILEGRPWLEKPPLYYWVTIPLYSILGVGETTARMGCALLGLFTGFFVFWMGSRLWSRRAGLFSAIVFLTSVGAAAYGRSASTDMPLTACLTAALALLGTAALKDLEGWKIRLAYIFLGLATLGKGPVAPVLVAGIAFSFWLMDEGGDFVRRWRVLPGFLVMTAVCLPWFWLAFRENGFAFTAIFILNHNVARYITDLHHHTQPATYFLPILPGLFFPWSAWLLIAWPRSLRAALRGWRTWDRRMLFLASWILFPLVFFSLSRSKLPGYVLPLLPPLSLIVGSLVDRSASVEDEGQESTEGGKNPAARNSPPLADARGSVSARLAEPRPSGNGVGNTCFPGLTVRRAVLLVAWAHLALSTILALLFPVLFAKSHGEGLVTGLPVAAACLLPALIAFFFAIRNRVAAAFGATALQGVAIILALTLFAFPAIGRINSTREIAREALKLRQGAEPIVTYNFFHHTLNYYTGYRIMDDLPDPVSLGKFAAIHPGFLVITEESHLPEIAHLERDGCSIAPLGEQGRLRLLRVNCR